MSLMEIGRRKFFLGWIGNCIMSGVPSVGGECWGRGREAIATGVAIPVKMIRVVEMGKGFKTRTTENAVEP